MVLTRSQSLKKLADPKSNEDLSRLTAKLFRASEAFQLASSDIVFVNCGNIISYKVVEGEEVLDTILVSPSRCIALRGYHTFACKTVGDFIKSANPLSLSWVGVDVVVRYKGFLNGEVCDITSCKTFADPKILGSPKSLFDSIDTFIASPMDE